MIETPARCLNCGAVLPPGTRYCPECGRTTRPRGASPWPWIVGGLLGLFLIVLLILLLRPQSPSVTAGEARAPEGPPVTVAPPSAPSGPPVVAAPPAARVPPPAPTPEDPNRAAVAAYLEKMAEIERRRKEIARQLLPSVLSLYLTYQMKRQLGGGDIENILKSFDEDVTEDAKQQAGDESEQQLLNTMETYKAQLRALAGDVQKINAPVPAQRFHNGYLVSLGSYDNAVSELQHSLIKRDASAVTRLSTLPQSLNGITSATDRELQRLLAQYNLPRTFSVSDEERGGLLSAP